MSVACHNNQEEFLRARSAMRARMLLVRRQVGSRERKRAQAAIVDVFLAAVSGLSFGCVAGYIPIAGELSPLSLLSRLEQLGNRVCLPVTDDQGSIRFVRWDTNQPLENGPLRTQQPVPPWEFVTPSVVFLPALAVDECGFRLGYGKGSYDRWIATQIARPTLIAVIYASQMVRTVFPRAHDQHVDHILTPDRMSKV